MARLRARIGSHRGWPGRPIPGRISHVSPATDSAYRCFWCSSGNNGVTQQAAREPNRKIQQAVSG